MRRSGKVCAHGLIILWNKSWNIISDFVIHLYVCQKYMLYVITTKPFRFSFFIDKGPEFLAA